jgi:hypothetical protein
MYCTVQEFPNFVCTFKFVATLVLRTGRQLYDANPHPTFDSDTDQDSVLFFIKEQPTKITIQK